MGNKEVILETVSDYWSLDRSSFDFFKKRLYEPEIDPVYEKYIGEDYRARWPLPNDKLKDLDEGWKYFRMYFRVFSRDKRITYEEFRDNKKLVGKNYVKLGKLLKDYYVNNIDDEFVQEMDLGGAHVPHKDAENAISRWVDRKLESIGRVKLPRGGIEIVLSANFEDWFFCSTGESWGSCLGFDSEYMYWAGLVGLAGDKNRAMLYITDNRKKEPISGTRVDKILSRSWTLLNEDDNIFFVKFYPNEYLGINYISDITGIDFYDNWGRFRSKHEVDLLYTNSGKSLYPYQDTTDFNSRARLIGGGKGHVFFHRDSDEPVDEEIFRHVDGGLFTLISENRTLEEFEREFVTCSLCGRVSEFEDDFFEVNGEFVCDSCFDENFFTCDSCREIHSKEEMNVVETTDELVCNLCFTEYYSECYICNEIVSKGDIEDAKVDGDRVGVCKSCAESEGYEECEECGVLHSKDELHVDEYDTPFCDKCLRKIIDKKQMKLFNAVPA
jgi:hypothetical protein